MKERPILFSGEMVRAILAGMKTQTRRVIKLASFAFRPGLDWILSVHQDGGGNWIAWSSDEPGLAEFTKKAYPHGEGFLCPYGRPGDRLWVREKWRVVGWHEGMPLYLEYAADGAKLDEPGDSSDYDENKYIQLYIDCSEDCERAGLTLDENECYVIPEGEKNPTRWRPSIHMPRWASRITLEVTGIRVQRIKEITQDEAISEGISIDPDDWVPELRFSALWNKINAKRGFTWESNPLVWVVEFSKATKGIN